MCDSSTVWWDPDQVAGDAKVLTGVTVIVNGQITGDLHVEARAEVSIHGQVLGAVRNSGGDVFITGDVGSVEDLRPDICTVEVDKDAVVRKRS